MKPQNVPSLPEASAPQGMIPASYSAVPALPAGYAPYYVQGSPEPEPESSGFPIAHYLWVLRRHAWKILAFVVACTVAVFVISSRMTPIYEATAIVDVDRQAPSSIVGEEERRSGGAADADQFLTTQVNLIQSDSVLRPVAQKYQLEQFSEKESGATPQSLQAPVVMTSLKVTRPARTYLLQISYRSPNPQLSADVANGVAQSYLQHTYNLRIRSSMNLSRFMEQQLEELRAKMEESGQALAKYEREMNVINPEEKTSILTARLLQLNQEFTTAQADRMKREAIWNSVKAGSLDSVEISVQAESQINAVNLRLNEAQQKFEEVKSTFGPTHPEYRKAATRLGEAQRQARELLSKLSQRTEKEYQQAVSREEILAKSVNEAKGEFDKVNARSFEYQQLKRGAEADRKLYEELVRKIKEAGINAGFQDSNIRIADLARPAERPVSPRIWLNVAMALVGSCFLGVAGVFLLDQMDTTIRDPETASRFLGTDVIGVLPAVKKADQLVKLALTGKNEEAETTSVVKAEQKDYYQKGYYRTISGFEEAIRTLRNTILLADMHGRMRSILLTSASPGEGKSTTAVHLAIAHAEQGKRTLILDGDLRRPSVHRKLGIPSNKGLSNILTGEIGWQEAMVSLEWNENVFVIPAGPPSHRAADLIGPRMPELLDELTREFDMVVIDAPPLLGFAEPLQMAIAADGVLIVSRAGETKRKAVSQVVGTLNRIRARVLGVVLNQVKSDSASSYSYYGYYQSQYYYGEGKS